MIRDENLVGLHVFPSAFGAIRPVNDDAIGSRMVAQTEMDSWITGRCIAVVDHYVSAACLTPCGDNDLRADGI